MLRDFFQKSVQRKIRNNHKKKEQCKKHKQIKAV